MNQKGLDHVNFDKLYYNIIHYSFKAEHFKVEKVAYILTNTHQANRQLHLFVYWDTYRSNADNRVYVFTDTHTHTHAKDIKTCRFMHTLTNEQTKVLMQITACARTHTLTHTHRKVHKTCLNTYLQAKTLDNVCLDVLIQSYRPKPLTSVFRCLKTYLQAKTLHMRV